MSAPRVRNQKYELRDHSKQLEDLLAQQQSYLQTAVPPIDSNMNNNFGLPTDLTNGTANPMDIFANGMPSSVTLSQLSPLFTQFLAWQRLMQITQQTQILQYQQSQYQHQQHILQAQAQHKQITQQNITQPSRDTVMEEPLPLISNPNTDKQHSIQSTQNVPQSAKVPPQSLRAPSPHSQPSPPVNSPTHTNHVENDLHIDAAMAEPPSPTEENKKKRKPKDKDKDKDKEDQPNKVRKTGTCLILYF